MIPPPFPGVTVASSKPRASGDDPVHFIISPNY